MKMFGHQNPANQPEMQLLPHLLQPLDEATAKAVRKEKRRAAISAGSDELELTGSVSAMVNRHGDAEYTPHGITLEENVPSGTQTPKTGCLRHPEGELSPSQPQFRGLRQCADRLQEWMAVGWRIYKVVGSVK
jgi:hypothetical protein